MLAELTGYNVNLQYPLVALRSHISRESTGFGGSATAHPHGRADGPEKADPLLAPNVRP